MKPSRQEGVLKLLSSCQRVGPGCSLCALYVPPSPQQQGEAVAGGEGRVGQQVELVATPSGRAGREDPASGGAAQARPLQQGEEDGG